MVTLIRSDLEFILQQILLAEGDPLGENPTEGIPNVFMPFGLRTVDGSLNNLVQGQGDFGSADQNFPSLLDQFFRNEGDDTFSFDPDGPGPAPTVTVENDNYATSGPANGNVVDADPRIISNLIVDQTIANPAAVQAFVDAGLGTIGPGGVLLDLDGEPIPAGVPLFIGNTTPDEGLSAGFNTWFVLFGQFFDHGLDLVNKGNNGSVFIPLQPDDPLYVEGSPTNFMILTRADNTFVGTDVNGNPVHLHNNQTTPFVDQNQTYTSHSSHQVFLREYILVEGRPVDTGKLLEGADGGLATWADIKAQAQNILGIQLDDQDVLNVPLLATDLYGNFIPDPDTGFPQVVMPGILPGSTVLVSGTPLAPVDATPSLKTNHAFLDDIAHAANPAGKTADPGSAVGLNTIELANGSFEADSMAADEAGPVQENALGNFIIGSPQGWTLAGTGGVYAPAPEANIVDPAGHTGGNVAWLNVGATLAQDTGASLEEGIVYRLTFRVGDRTDQDFGGGTARLVTADGDILAEIALPSPDSGQWANVTLTTAAIAGANAGEELRIEIVNSGGSGGGQILVDNVQLTTVTPGTYDNELLDKHFITGDGRGNENIGLTAVHQVFHSEHNRMVEQLKQTILDSNDDAFISQWVVAGADLSNGVQAAEWDGQRLFQAARFTTEMQYQHLVFEEFARKIQPNVDAFLAPGYDAAINPAIVAEFAHVVYRFGHSMLTETVDRLDENFVSDDIGLIEAFLNPLEFVASGATPEEAAGAIIRGTTRQLGNEIDEFVTEALRNNLVGLPLDLAAINIARGRETGVPSLNAARAEFYQMTGDSQLKAYTSWVDFGNNLKHPASLINFIAAYGTHAAILAATDNEARREAAMALVFGDGDDSNGVVINGVNYTNRLDFLYATGDFAGGALGGLNNVDLWIGGLAEKQMPFGGLLGSTFNFVFETQLEALQNGDRFYYLSRLAGQNFLTELENNSFAKLIMANTDVTRLPADVFSTPNWILEVDTSKQFTGIGLDGRDDPTEGGTALRPLVIRDNPLTAGPDSNYLQYTGGDHVVLGGTNPGNASNPSGNDILIGSVGDDTLWGDGGNDRLEGGDGVDNIEGGAGDDIITDMGGDDILKGGEGNDVIHGGNGFNLIIGGPGSDFIITGEDFSDTFAGTGNDFILGAKTNLPTLGNEGDDWIEIGTQDGAPGDNFDEFSEDLVSGNDVFVGGGGFDEMLGEGGDDIFVGSEGEDHFDGASGFDWVTFKNDTRGVTADMLVSNLIEPPVAPSNAGILDRYAFIEGLSGSARSDVLLGDNADAADIAAGGARGSILNQAGIDLIDGLQDLLGPVSSFGSGNIILGGGGSDIIDGRGGDDIIDGDRWLNVRVSVRDPNDHTQELFSVDSIADLVPQMLSGEINPGQLEIVREIIDDNDGFDTALFSGPRANYTVINGGDGIVTVIDNVGTDGIDRLTNIERLQFANDVEILVPGLNAQPVGAAQILLNNVPLAGPPQEGQLLRASIAGVTDADGIPGPISYMWQVETVPGTGIFDDIVDEGTGDKPATASGPTFLVPDGFGGSALRVKATYQDGHGVLETVFSAPTGLVLEGVPEPVVVMAPEAETESTGVHFIRSDLMFILDQIKIAERHAAGEDLTDILANSRLPFGLRTVDGSYNNLVAGQEDFGAADQNFASLLDQVFRDEQDGETFDSNGPAPGGVVTNTNYATSGPGAHVVDSDPRTISNLIVDQTVNNPAAIAAAIRGGGSEDVPGDTARFLAALQAIEDAEAEAAAELLALQQAIQAAQNALPGFQEDVANAQTVLGAAEAADAQAALELGAAQTAQSAALTAYITALTAFLLSSPPGSDPSSDPEVSAALDAYDAAIDVTAAAQLVKDGTAADVVTAAQSLTDAQTALAVAEQDVVDAQAAYDTALAGDPEVVAAQADFDALVEELGVHIVASPGPDTVFGTADDKEVFQIDNLAPDEGLSAGFNAWMTFFGQFFDHGLDLVNKGGSGTIFIPLAEDDPLYVPGGFSNFMVLTRATNTGVTAGADGAFGTSDDVHFHNNQTTPFIDQNQTYTSHPSHQVFLREYVLVNGRPVDTGKLLEGADGGLATWADIKHQAQTILGFNLTDAHLGNIPGIITDPYGNFIPAANGFPQLATATGVIVGDPTAPGGLGVTIPANYGRTDHAFLDDIAHTAAPVFVSGVLAPDDDNIAGNAVETNPLTGQRLEYDDELLDAHYITGDGRGNENIGLTAVHHVFHSEHNRLVDHIKDVAVASNDVGLLNEYLRVDLPLNFDFPDNAADRAALVAQLNAANAWDGARVFQAARFGTEMQYQHLVFEEFARKIQPQVDIFFAATQVYDTDINPAILAEFAHVVYRFGHSMLTETVDRFDPSFNVVGDGNPTEAGNQQTGLVAAFLNPLAFVASGASAEEAAGAIVRGTTRQVGNEIDEFVTEALRNNLLGLPLDLPAINIARGRDTGVPSLNVARAEFYQMTGDSQLKPYISWVDFMANLKHPESLINFIAAYGTHDLITGETTLEGKRAAAFAIVTGASVTVFGAPGEADDRVIQAPGDRLDFLNATGEYAGGSLGGLNDVDLWIGGLAERKMPFGGMLGSTFNFVFETQMEMLQDGDRFYYLDRTASMSFLVELESNSFAKLISANTDAKHLPGDVFSTPAWILEVEASKQFTGLGTTGRDDPIEGGTLLRPIVIRDNPLTAGPDTNYLEYTGEDHVVLGGTDPGNAFNPSGNDILIASIGDDTVHGDAGNDRMEGGDGNDFLFGGSGDDIITDKGGDDNIQGGDGNDVIHGGNGINLLLGGFGSDFIITGQDSSETFAGAGNDFILGAKANEVVRGNEGDDWLQFGMFDGEAGDNFDPFAADTVIGHDVFYGDSIADRMDGEGGDDIMMGNGGQGDRYEGMSGFDWASFQHHDAGVAVDMRIRAFDETPLPLDSPGILTRFVATEGLSGSTHSDILQGDDADAAEIAGGETPGGNILTRFDLVAGLRDFVEDLVGGPVTSFGAGNIILGGDGSDIIIGGGGDDLIDGDARLNVYISVRANSDGSGPEIASFSDMVPLVPLMLAGTYNPGQLVIVRELIDNVNAIGNDFDTARFTGVRADYTVVDNGNDTWTITDNVGADGIDTVRNIERLQFADESLVLGGLNNGPAGLLSITGTPEEGGTLTVSITGVTDADNEATDGQITGPVTYFWQVETDPGVFEDILREDAPGAGGETIRATGPTFTPNDAEVGLRIRVRAIYQDENGVLEEVFSAPTVAVDNANDAPTAGPTINDTTPTQGRALTVNVLAIVDPDGTTTAVANDGFTFQWQESADGGATWTDIPGPEATIAFFTPGADQVGKLLHVVVSYIDDGGDPNEIASAPTGVVGALFLGTNAANPFVGTEGQDELFGEGGVDNLSGLGGNDLIEGGSGNDILDGGDGNDTLTGGVGTDTIGGGGGNDTIIYAFGDGADAVDGGAGTDRLDATGTAGNDILNVVFNGTSLTSFEVGALAGVEVVNADLLDGVDTLTYAGTAANVSVNLSAGTASGFTTIAGIENVTSGTGADTLTGNAAANALNGGGGNDTFIATVGDGNDTYTGTGGIDTYDLSGTTAGATVNLVLGTSTSAQTGNDALLTIENVVGSSGNDTITSDAGAQTLTGGGGDDTLSSGAANDRFVATVNDGTDSYTGGAGADTYDLSATTAAATVDLVSGTSTSGQTGSDTLATIENIVGGSGGDTIGGSAAANVLDGGSGNDTLTGLGGADTLIGGLGDDTLTGGAAADNINAGDGNDTINWTVGDGRDIVDGGAGIDTFHVEGAAGNDVFWIETREEYLARTGGAILASTEIVVSRGTTLLNGVVAAELAGIDEISVNSNGGTNTFIVEGDFTGTDLDLNTITLHGSSGNDTVDVSGRRSDHRIVFTSNGGNDRVLGALSAQDVVELPPGATMDAGNVHDNGDGTCTVVNGEHKVTAAATAPMFAPYVSSQPPTEGPPETAPISGTNNRNDLQGTDAADRILGLRGDDKLYGRDGDDLLDGGEGEDRMYGGRGDDTYVVDDRDDRVSEERGQGTDTVETTLTSYSLGRDLENLQHTGTRDFHGKGNDADNAIAGGSGNDRLEGRDGDDVITGGAGNDRMWGGDDSDTFVFAQGFGNDRIYDFDADPRKGQDMLDISELGITAGTFADLVDIDVTSGDTVITIGEHSVTLLDVNGRGSNAITQADFIFA